MKRFLSRLSFLIALALTATVGLAQSTAPENALKSFTLTTEHQKSLSVSYLLYLPEKYNSSEPQRWPLIVFLHGSGERGSDVHKVAVHGPPKVAPRRPGFPFIVAAPQCPENRIWDREAVMAVVQKVETDCHVDPDRIYLTGLSMGGFGSWDLAVTHPEKWAAVAPICGGGDIIGILCASPQNSEKLKSLPIWAFHGGQDGVVPPTESERMVAAFRRLGNTGVQLTIYPDANHDSWTRTYDDDRFYEWLLKHNRRTNGQPAADSQPAGK
jgi:predicted peptidase